MTKTVNARLIVDNQTIQCSQAIFSMIVPSGLNGVPNHLKQEILLDVYFNLEDPSVKSSEQKVIELYNRIGESEMDIQIDIDDDFKSDETLARVKFRGRLHGHNMLRIPTSPNSDVPDIHGIRLQLAPTLNNGKDRPVTMHL
jgi:hypothetical protein